MFPWYLGRPAPLGVSAGSHRSGVQSRGAATPSRLHPHGACGLPLETDDSPGAPVRMRQWLTRASSRKGGSRARVRELYVCDSRLLRGLRWPRSLRGPLELLAAHGNLVCCEQGLSTRGWVLGMLPNYTPLLFSIKLSFSRKSLDKVGESLKDNYLF